jgi:hypothetical protein
MLDNVSLHFRLAFKDPRDYQKAEDCHKAENNIAEGMPGT